MGCAESNGAEPSKNTTQQPTTSQQPQNQTQNTSSAQKPTTTANTNTSTAKPATVTTQQKPKASSSIHEQELAKHNEYRQKHHAEPLVLSDWLNKGAQSWADHLAKNKKFEHSQCNIAGKGVGENIYFCSGAVKGGDASKAWYDEVKDYKYGKGQSTFSQTGHFSQLVWKVSKEVGFGFSGGIVVANYYPAGNLMGSWEKNVEKP